MGKEPKMRIKGIENVQHMIVSLLESGLSIFHQSFVDENIDPDLFSALITATSVQQKIQSNRAQRILQEQFQIEDYTAHVCHGEYLAGIIVSSTEVSRGVMNRFLKFLATFEEEYKFIFKNAWNGDRSFFDQDWARHLLDDILTQPDSGLRLVKDAMSRAQTARHMRLVLLIKRYDQENPIPQSDLVQMLEKDLQIPSSQAKEYISDLTNVGILSLT